MLKLKDIKLKYFACLFSFLLFSLSYLPLAYAVGGLDDDFEAYSTGDLNGQGGWWGSGLFDVTTALYKTGAQSVICSANSAINIQFNISSSSGDFNQYWWWRTPSATGEIADVVFRDEGYNERLYINLGSCGNGKICYYNFVGGWNEIMSGYSVDTWYKMQVTFRTGSNEFDIYIDDVKLVDSVAWVGNTIDYIKLYKRPFTNTIYYDDFKTEIIVKTYLTSYNHTGISNLWVNGTQKANATETEFNQGQTANLTAGFTAGFNFQKWEFINTTIYSYANPAYLVMGSNESIHAYATTVSTSTTTVLGGGGSAGTGFIIMAVITSFAFILTLTRKR